MEIRKISDTWNWSRSKIFIYIDDFISGFAKFIKKENLEIYNIGTSEKIKISKLAILIAKLFNKDIKLKNKNFKR